MALIKCPGCRKEVNTLKRAICLLICILMFGFLLPSLADETTKDFTIFNVLSMKGIENLARKYPNEIRIKKYYSTAKFVKAAGISSSEGKGWVLLIDLGNTLSIALSDNVHHVIIDLADTSSKEYNIDIDNLMTMLIENIDEFIIQANQRSKAFSILEV